MPIDGLGSLEQKLSLMVEEVIPGAKEKSLGQAMLLIKKSAQAGIRTSTGGTRDNIHDEVVQTKDGSYEGRVYTVGENAVFEEFGTGPRGKASKKDLPEGVSIQYKDKGWLVPVKYWPDYARYGIEAIEIKGELFVPTKGKEAHPYMEPAARKNRKKAVQIIKKQIQEDLKGLKK